MIVQWLWEALAAFLGWLVHLFPTFTVPVWAETMGGYISDGVSFANGWHMWIPLAAVRNCVVFLLAVSTAILAVRGFRILVSLFTGGGGSAA